MISNGPTDYQDPDSIDVDEVAANVLNSYRLRSKHWDDKPVWPNVTVLALVNRIEFLEERLQDIKGVVLMDEPTHISEPLLEAWQRLNEEFEQYSKDS